MVKENIRAKPKSSTKRKYAKEPQPFAIATGRQLTIDSSRLFILDKSTQWARLDRWQKLTLFEAIYRGQEIATGAVNLLTRFINTPMVPETENVEIAKRMNQIWRDIDGPTVNAMLIRQSLVFGFSCGEWCSSDMETMDGVVVPPSIELRKIPDRQGQIESYVQLPGFSPWGTTVDGRTPVPAIKMIDVVRDPMHSFHYYGSSLFESALDQFESLCKILDSQIRVYLRLGRPRFQVTVNADGLTPEQLQERINQTKQKFATLGDLDSSDIYMPAGTEIKIIGAESFGQRFADESRMVLSQICSGIGLPASLLNIVLQQSGNTESFVRQQVIALMSQIEEIQRSISHAWNRSFWKVVQRMERMPEAPSMSFEKSRLLEQTLEEQGRDLCFKNDFREVVHGIRPIAWLAQRCGASEPDDIRALTKQVENARTLSEPQELSSSDIDSTTKATDERATKNATM
jgi:hypothetical protein